MPLVNKLTNVADAIREKTGSTGSLTLDGMVTAIEGIEGSCGTDAATQEEIAAQSDLIKQIRTALDTKRIADPTLQSKVVTPSADSQTVSFDEDYDGLSQVVVNGDSNLTPSNIAEGVSIFGVEGTHSGGSGGGLSGGGLEGYKEITYVNNTECYIFAGGCLLIPGETSKEYVPDYGIFYSVFGTMRDLGDSGWPSSVEVSGSFNEGDLSYYSFLGYDETYGVRYGFVYKISEVFPDDVVVTFN